MFKNGQKYGVYPIIDNYATKKGQCYRSEDPFFNSPILLNLYPLTNLSEEQQIDLRKKLDSLFLFEHPLIAPVTDSGVEGGYYYFTTPYYSEASFEQHVADGITSSDVITLLVDLAQAFDQAQSCNLFHGIFEPEDLVVDEDGFIKLVNFGVRHCFAQVQSETECHESLSNTLDSLGHYIHKLLSVQVGQEGSDENHLSLKAVIDRCLSQHPQHYRSFKDLLIALESFVGTTEKIDVHQQGCLSKEMQRVGVATISEEQRVQILPHVRELISEKNKVQADLDAKNHDYDTVRQELNEALIEADNLSRRLHLATKFNQAQKRKKMVTAVFSGMVAGLLMTIGSFSFFNTESGSQKPVKLKVEQAVISSLSEAVQGTVEMDAEKHSSPQPPETMANSVNLKETPVDTVMNPRKDELTRSVIEGGKRLFHTAIVQAAVIDTRGFDDAEKMEIKGVITDWSEHWARQDIDGYFHCYSDHFQPAGGVDTEIWKKKRIDRLKRPDWIEVGIDHLKIDFISKRSARIRFDQHYRSDLFVDRNDKEIVLAKEVGGWRITEEKSLKY